jgi:hypothetical protein
LHWVVKVSDLKKSIELLSLLGARVLRHEIFDRGCEATCNGKYDGKWSKTMVGWMSEDESFVFELTYNYGVTNYRRGNDLNAIILHKYNHLYQDMEFKLCAQFDEASSAKGEDGIYRLLNGDFVLKFLPSSSANNKQLV